ncbi:MAG TPA: maleylpyruvate isomerase N-terminal domain-containing protein [Dermatophilaceae bacterium]|nr:maleylpyruvate isomerase N-terminal domain-containing protein [Dermatophilaceae bacterium]
MPGICSAYLDAASTLPALLRTEGLAEAWPHPSALAKMSVGALAAHLGAQVLMVPGLLRAEPDPTTEVVPLLGHYARVAWVDADLDDEVMVAIRAGGERAAMAGPAALVDGVEVALVELGDLLGSVEGAPVTLPWVGWSLTRTDFLLTRMMEVVVHSDDLAASLGIEAPALPPAVLQPVLGLLTALSVRRHGQAAVVRALTRAERAPADITAF